MTVIMKDYYLEKVANRKSKLEDANFNIDIRNKAIGYIIDQEGFLENKDNVGVNIEDIQEMIEKSLKKTGMEKGSELDSIKKEITMLKSTKESLRLDYISDITNAYTEGNFNIDDLMESIHELNRIDGFSYNNYAKILLTSKTEKEFNLIMENGQRNDPKNNFESGLYEEILNLGRYTKWSSEVSDFATQQSLEDMRNYYISTKERTEEFISIASGNDRTLENPIVENDFATAILLGKEIDLSLLKKNEKNINNVGLIISNLIKGTRGHLVENLTYNGLSSLNQYYIDKFEEKGMFNFIDNNKWKEIYSDIKTSFNDKGERTFLNRELSNLNSEVRVKMNDENNHLSLESKLKAYENNLIEVKKQIEITNSILDYIDYGFHGVGAFENNLNLAKESEVTKEIQTVFPHIKARYPSDQEADKVREEKINDSNYLSKAEERWTQDLKEKMLEEINTSLISGVSLKDQDVVGYLNYLDTKQINDFELRMIPLVKAKDENEFNEIYKELNGEHKIDFEVAALKALLTKNDTYNEMNKDGYMASKIDQYIDRFNKNANASLDSYFVTSHDVTDFAIENFNKFKNIYPKDVSEGTLQKTSLAITNKLAIDAIVRIQLSDESGANKLFEIIKAFNQGFDNKNELNKIVENMSKDDDLIQTKFYDDFKTLASPEEKKKLKM